MILVVVVDGGLEMKGDFPDGLKALGTKVIPTSAYNPKANGICEAGHFTLASMLKKIINDESIKWMNNLKKAIFIDRCSIRASYGLTPFYLVYGWDPVFPFEVETPIWRLINWNEIKSTPELIALRIRILQRKEEDVLKAREKVHEFRTKIATRTDNKNKNRFRKDPLSEGDLALRFNVPRANDMSTKVKLLPRWDGPFRIYKTYDDRPFYQLKTLDGIVIPKPVHGDQLKKFKEDP